MKSFPVCETLHGLANFFATFFFPPFTLLLKMYERKKKV
ncbi:hypothetical protein bcere0002_39590 [Bacillus cereus ATCC 10876]|nr:hypothetical protein CT43_CH4101 [Bacillus thuringiensis serovar chinensis CT-43]AGG02878.1 hypothetical protein H175_ch4166 [Bacillus thuringiensis serovar thuringiensis str. IS5056]EEK49110.1 hypothetical protein bcere0002_39590 [Bacillus cereus ATCC 10876]EEK60599.1 hypothetical protein bcere0005_37190 [Bacillus cereus 172560W]EEK93302.1 hypothetical protein bcere0012_38100 [Bacillus cereus BDRD-ST24]EEL27243.1 hypothetical protein bcere0018_38130 [Bacillus cereus Rock1-15]EEL54456.1 hy